MNTYTFLVSVAGVFRVFGRMLARPMVDFQLVCVACMIFRILYVVFAIQKLQTLLLILDKPKNSSLSAKVPVPLAYFFFICEQYIYIIVHEHRAHGNLH